MQSDAKIVPFGGVSKHPVAQTLDLLQRVPYLYGQQDKGYPSLSPCHELQLGLLNMVFLPQRKLGGSSHLATEALQGSHNSGSFDLNIPEIVEDNVACAAKGFFSSPRCERFPSLSHISRRTSRTDRS